MTKKTTLFEHTEFQGEFSLTNELPYWDFLDGENPCAVLSDGTLIQGFSLKGVAIETWDEAQVNGLTTQIRGLLNSLPDGADLQFLIESNSDYSEKITEHEKLKGNNPVISWIADTRVQALREGVRSNQFQRQNLYLFVYLRVKATRNFLSTFFSKPKQFISTRKEEHEKRVRELCQITESLRLNLESMGLNATPLSSKSIFDLAYRILNPKRSNDIGSPKLSPVHKDQEFLNSELQKVPALSEPSPREQLVFSDLIQGVEGFFLDGYYHRIVSLKTLPEFTHAAMISKLVSLPFHFVTSVQVVVPEQSKELSSLQAKRRMAHSMSISHGGRATDLESEAKLQSTEELLRELIQTGQKIFYFQVAVLLRAEKLDDLNLQTKTVLSKLREMNGSEGIAETVAGFKVFKTMLPAGNTTLVRSKRVKTDNLADFVPVYQPWEGQGKPVCLFQDRNAGLVSYDPFDSAMPNYSSLVTGASGSGKSFLNNCILLQYLTQNPLVYIIDIGGSYKKLCEFLGGQYVEMIPNKDGTFPQAINPFLLPPGSTEPSAQKIKFLIAFLEVILIDKEGDKLPRLSKSLLEEAILETYKRFLPDRMPRLSDLKETLEKSTEQDLKNYAKMLYPWTGARPYGRLLDAENSLALNADFVVFDLKGLSNSDLLPAVILIITDFILGKVESVPNRRKQIYMDECWSLLKAAATFMEYCVRTLRKNFSGITFITQGLTEIEESDIGAAILNNTATKFILMQRGDMEIARKILKLNEQEVALVRSLRQQKGHYSEAFLIANDQRGVIRIVPTPVEYWLATSDAADNQLLAEARNQLQGKSLPEIIHWLAENYPQGSQGVTQLNEIKEVA